MSEPQSFPTPSLPNSRSVWVALENDRAYTIHIGRGLLAHAGKFLKSINLTGTPVIITDHNVAREYFQIVKNALGKGPLPTIAYRIPGEDQKTLQSYEAILKDLADENISRSGVIVALGGGVIGDLAGFVAATYKRGIALVQIPTSLLAMVDSSVGGKTGVNLGKIKNIVGAFHQPRIVIVDLDTLETLLPREFNAGMAEVIKYGAIRDRDLFDRVAVGIEKDDPDLEGIIEKCVQIKADIVSSDEFETKGERALLNFGHTIGHAIEKVIEIRNETISVDGGTALPPIKAYVHGEAISLGMRAAAWLSVWCNKLPCGDAVLVEKALHQFGLPLYFDGEFPRHLLHSSMRNDKKIGIDGKIQWVLLDKLGCGSPNHDVPLDLVEKAIDLLQKKPDWLKVS